MKVSLHIFVFLLKIIWFKLICLNCICQDNHFCVTSYILYHLFSFLFFNRAYVSFNEKSRCMGVSAKNQSTTNLKNTVSCFKRFIGRAFTDPFVQNELKNHFRPYQVVEGPNGKINIQV